MKHILRSIVIALALSSVGTAKPIEIATTAWHIGQAAAGSTMGLFLCELIKEDLYRNQIPKPKEASKPPLSSPHVRLAPIYVPKNKKNSRRPHQSSQPSTSSSSESVSVEASRIFAQPEPQPSCFENLKKLPRTCLQALSIQSMMKIWVFATIAITSYTTASAGIQGLATDLGY